jgi:exopolyphosphatase / guanosine-5'-triphosphate,3'-diphosphate pyrophosphatase
MRLAALDLGSNSFHALIADVDRAGRLEVVDRAKRMPRIGEGIFRSGEITFEARKQAIQAIAELLPIIAGSRPDALHAVATAAVREARNGHAFVDEVRARFGLEVSVISGDEEARLSYAGARAELGDEVGQATLFDLGGGSLEAIVGDGARIVGTASAPLGVLRAVVERPLSDPPTAHELRALKAWARGVVGSFLEPLGGDLGEIVLCAGTARAVCSVACALGDIPAAGRGAERIGRDTLRRLIGRLTQLPLAARRETPGLEPNRADLIVPGMVMLDAILAAARVEQARICRAALREGLILDRSRALRTPARRRARRRALAARSETPPPSRTATTRAGRAAFAP